MKSRDSRPNVQIAPAEDRGQRLEAAANIEDKRQWMVLLRILEQEVAEVGLAASGHAQNQGVRNFAVVQVQKVRRGIIGFKDRQVFRAEMLIPLLSRQNCEEKREIRVVRVQQQQAAQIHHVVAGHRSKVGVELVVGLNEQAPISIRKHARKLAHQPIDFVPVTAIENNGQRELAKRLAIAQCPQAVAEVFDIGLLRFIDQNIAWVRFDWIVAQLRDESGFRNVEVATALVHFLSGFIAGSVSTPSPHRNCPES